MNMIHEIFGDEVINDYYTANVKAEVIFDTMLTPVISEILTVACFEETNEKMNFIAKEFPLINDENSFRSRNADYLMHDDNYVYLVELKTTQDSINNPQMENYLSKVCGAGELFSTKLGSDFIYLLNWVSRTGISKWKGGTKKEDLEELFERIINYPEKTIQPKNERATKEKYALKAINYLKSNQVCSSKKYLFTAGQILDHMGDGKWWDHEIKLLYLVPKKPENSFEKNDIIWVSIEEIIQKKQQIREKIEGTELKEYWDWVVSILEQCL